MAGEAESAAEALLRGARRAGVDACVYLPDSVLSPTVRAFRASGEVLMVPCAREDEGIAIAVGLDLGGRNPVCMMEASGLGYSGLILARAQVQRTPVTIVASHTAGGGEPMDYHGATRLLSDGIFRGIDIPFEVASDREGLEDRMFRAVQTARGQRSCFGLLIPPYVMRGASR